MLIVARLSAKVRRPHVTAEDSWRRLEDVAVVRNTGHGEPTVRHTAKMQIRYRQEVFGSVDETVHDGFLRRFFLHRFYVRAAILLLSVRVRSRMLRLLLAFQLLFLLGTGLILVFFTQIEVSLGNPLVEVVLPAVIMAVNIAV